MPEGIGRENYSAGDIFQITENFGGDAISRRGWIGSLVVATDVRDWGIMGYISYPETHEKNALIYIRLKWECIEYVGKAVLVTDDIAGSEKPADED